MRFFHKPCHVPSWICTIRRTIEPRLFDPLVTYKNGELHLMRYILLAQIYHPLFRTCGEAEAELQHQQGI